MGAKLRKFGALVLRAILLLDVSVLSWAGEEEEEKSLGPIQMFWIGVGFIGLCVAVGAIGVLTFVF